MLFKFVLLILAIIGVSGVQLIIKLRFNAIHGEMPASSKLLAYMIGIIKDPWMWFAGLLLVVAAFTWYFVVSRISLGIAFAFGALSYPLIMAGSYVMLGESFSLVQMIGCAMIVGGISLIALYM